MPPHTFHASPKKNRFIGAVQAGMTVSEAAQTYQLPKSTAYDLWKKYQSTGSTHSLPKSGRPKKVTDRTHRYIIHDTKKNRRKPFKAIGLSLTPVLSESTVRRALDEVGLHRRKARSVVYLKDVQKEKRRQWAEDCRGFTDNEWARIIWSDEAYVCIGDNKGDVYVTRAAGEEYDENCVVPTFKQSSIRVMVWGCIMKDNKGPMVVLEYPGGKGGGMNAERYREQVLDKVLYDYYVEKTEEKGWVLFQQDGAPSHKGSRSWFTRNSVELFPHPPSSPDLSPIEPLWNTFKKNIRSRPHQPTSLNELKLAAREAWDALTSADINRHIDAMPQRVEAVLAANGGHTQY